ncbi:MAG TPA: T9SS type A sorting domain-containing protein, partial [Bacteroidia bacterium]|nr:T9SS type A sorting domain-containing protein [Bacteroidia bacterium]
GGDSTNLFGGGYFPTSLLYSVVDMTLDNNKGDVTLKNQIIITDTLGGAINAVKHGNGRDWWVFNFRYNSNTIYGLLITPNGIQGPYTQNFGDSIIGAVGQGCFSPDGSQFARYNKYFPYNDLDVYDFDRCTGLFSNWRNVKINDSTSAGGVAFSPNGIYIYVSSLTKVYQFCTDSLNLANSMDTVAIYDGFVDPITPLPTTFFLAHLAPDAKIYFNCGYSVTYMHVINNPDTVAKFCGMVQHGIKVPTFNAWTMPNLPNYHLGPKYGSVCDSLSTDLTPNPSPFGEGNSLRINPNPSAGNFYVNYTLPPNTNGVLHIYDLVGNEVMQKNVYWYFGYLQIDATTLQNGMYIASLEIGGRHWAGGKIVISK